MNEEQENRAADTFAAVLARALQHVVAGVAVHEAIDIANHEIERRDFNERQ